MGVQPLSFASLELKNISGGLGRKLSRFLKKKIDEMSESQNLNIFDQYLTPSNRGGLAPNHQASISRTLAMTVACMRILYRLSSCYGFEEIGIFIKNGQGPPQPPNGV